MWWLDVNLVGFYRTFDWDYYVDSVVPIFSTHSNSLKSDNAAVNLPHEARVSEERNKTKKEIKEILKNKNKKKKRKGASWLSPETVTAIIHSSAPQGAAHSNAAVDVCAITKHTPVSGTGAESMSGRTSAEPQRGAPFGGIGLGHFREQATS